MTQTAITQKQSRNVLAKIDTLKGRALDWAVDALLRGDERFEVLYKKDGSDEWMWFSDGLPYPSGPQKFSSDEKHGSRLIQEKGISVVFDLEGPVAGFYAPEVIPEAPHLAHAVRGETLLEAACRAFLARSHGRHVYIPIELAQSA